MGGYNTYISDLADGYYDGGYGSGDGPFDTIMLVILGASVLVALWVTKHEKGDFFTNWEKAFWCLCGLFTVVVIVGFTVLAFPVFSVILALALMKFFLPRKLKAKIAKVLAEFIAEMIEIFGFIAKVICLSSLSLWVWVMCPGSGFTKIFLSVLCIVSALFAWWHFFKKPNRMRSVVGNDHQEVLVKESLQDKAKVGPSETPIEVRRRNYDRSVMLKRGRQSIVRNR